MSLETYVLKSTRLAANSPLPVLIYRGAFPRATAEKIESVFSSNGWQPQWRFGMYKQAHYHSTTHEALGVFQGSAKLRLGRSDSEGEGGIEIEVQSGDALVLPAGTMHRALLDADGFTMVGAYPRGAPQWDMLYGETEQEKQDVQPRLAGVQIPEKDPVTGSNLSETWHA